MGLRSTKEKDRVYMREYMRRYRRAGREVKDVGDRRPIALPPVRYADLAAAIFGDPPIGRRAIDAKQLSACHQAEGER